MARPKMNPMGWDELVEMVRATGAARKLWAEGLGPNFIDRCRASEARMERFDTGYQAVESGLIDEEVLEAALRLASRSGRMKLEMERGAKDHNVFEGTYFATSDAVGTLVKEAGKCRHHRMVFLGHTDTSEKPRCQAKAKFALQGWEWFDPISESEKIAYAAGYDQSRVTEIMDWIADTSGNLPEEVIFKVKAGLGKAKGRMGYADAENDEVFAEADSRDSALFELLAARAVPKGYNHTWHNGMSNLEASYRKNPNDWVTERRHPPSATLRAAAAARARPNLAKWLESIDGPSGLETSSMG